MDNNFYICKKIKINETNDPLLFYHVPKCAGTTFSVIFSWLISPQTRIKGPLFVNNDKGGATALQLFKKCKDFSFYNNFNLIYGHLPFESYKFFTKKFKKITVLRDPIERSLSHYNWMINRGYCAKGDDLQEIFDSNKITKNTITNQFSGLEYTQKNDDKVLNLSYKNLTEKIDYLYNSKEIFYLFKLLISKYQLPNLIFQNQQGSTYQNNYNTDNYLKVIRNNNQMDIELFKMLLKNDKFSKKITNDDQVDDSNYFFSSPNVKCNGKNNIIINKDKYEEILKQLNENNFNLKIIK